MAISKEYAGEVTIGTVALDLSSASPSVAGGGYGRMDMYLEDPTIAPNVSYDLHRRVDTADPPTAANPRGYVGTFQKSSAGARLELVDVPLVQNQTFYVNGGTGTGTLKGNKYTWGNSL